MISVKVKKNFKPYIELKLNKQQTVKQLIADLDIPPVNKLAYAIDGDFVNLDYQIDSDCEINIVGIDSLDGHRIYQDTAIFIMMKAFHNLFPPSAKLVVEHSIGDGIYCEVFGHNAPTQASAADLEAEMHNIVRRNLPIRKEDLYYHEVRQVFEEEGRNDLVRNLRFLPSPLDTIDNIYRCGQFYDYFIRQLAPTTGVITQFKVQYLAPGLVLRFPKLGETKVTGENHIPQKLFKTHQEHDKWLNILKCHNVADLNRRVAKYDILEFIQMEEALQEKKIANFADYIKDNPQARLVLIAGPSSSGKTTFARRLSIQMRVNGLVPVVVGLDDYFLPRSQTPRKADGEFDYETIDALNLPQLNQHLTQLLAGEQVELPRYNFLTGDSEPSHHFVQLKENNILVMEGIHGLNERLTQSIPRQNKIKIYISNLNQLNIDRHNRIPTSDSRKIRRISRDYLYRGYSVEDTLMRWESIREGEEKHIFPYQEEADLMINSGLTYELAVLKKYVKPLFIKVPRNSPVYAEARRLEELLDHMLDIPDEFVPTNSLIREFTKGSIFY